MSETFEEQRFRRRVDKALTQAKAVLDVERAPKYPQDVSHSYADKYLLTESLVNLSVAAQVTALQAMGLTDEALLRALRWRGQGHTVTLRLKAEHRCEYDREESREEEGNTEVVTKLVGVFKRSDKTFTTIIEHFWNFSFAFELVLFAGTDVDGGLVLNKHSGKHEIVTRSKEPPRPKVAVKDAVDLNLNWLLKNINAESLGTLFGIYRGHEKCFTPRRNPAVEQAIEFFSEANNWGSKVRAYFFEDLFEAQQPHGLDTASINDSTLFVPVLPLFEKPGAQKKEKSDDEDKEGKGPFVVKKEEAGGFGMLLSSVRGGEAPSPVLVPYAGRAQEKESPLLSPEDFGRLLAEQHRSLEEKLESQEKVFPSDKCITPVEARLALLAGHQCRICEAVFDGLNYVEDMLRQQLIAAIGKAVQPQDFAAYMMFHNRKLFRDEFRPRAFSYAVRRLGHSPEGEVSIMAQLHGADASLPEPIQTLVSRTPIVKPMSFGLDAASKVSFTGELLVHGWMGHQFSGDSGLSLSLNARARQFSSFLVLVGRITGPGLFDPKYGMICKDKDEFRIPLELETIPSAKEFKEAISSLSEAQQRFAKAYRSMQLSSTLFGICVIQIKPQLEKLLKVPDDSLTKEIELSQDILQLFIKYQIPSDLLSYDYTDGRPHIPAVRTNVKTMMEMIGAKKAEEVKEAVIENVFESLPASRPAPPPPQIMEARQELSQAESYQSQGIVSRLASFFRSGAEASSAANGAMPTGAASNPLYDTMDEPDMSTMVLLESSPDVAQTETAPTKSQPAPKEKTEVAEKDEGGDESKDASTDVVGEADHLMLLPKKIEQRFEADDKEGAVRPTIINVGDGWTKRSQLNLLADPKTDECFPEDQRLERQACFDLLDALTRCGGLSIDNASLHVVIAASHCFDKSVMNVLVQKNESPIESVERSMLTMASTIFDRPATELIKPAEVGRVKQHAPQLFTQE